MTDDRLEIFSQFRRVAHWTLPDGSIPLVSGLSGFSRETVTDWYLARHYVLHMLPPLDGNGIGPGSGKSVSVVVQGTSGIMLSIVRQIALLAHYPNFDEQDGSYRTSITILYDRHEVKDIYALLEQQEYLGHLPKYCSSMSRSWDTPNMADEDDRNDDSYLDIELNLVGFDHMEDSEEYIRGQRRDVLVLKEDEVLAALADVKADDIFSVDVRDARRVNMVYHVGADIDNLPPDDPNTADRYSRALHYFCYQLTPADTQARWNAFFQKDGRVDGQVALRNLYSNVCCADCFDARLRSVLTPSSFRRESRKDPLRWWKAKWSRRYAAILSKKDGEAFDAEEMKWLLTHEYRRVLRIVKDNLLPLSRSEHVRWVTERLIMGYSPLSESEILWDEQHFGAEKRANRKYIKNDLDDLYHIDICSYRDLRRINPEDMKYDCFLMMAMTWIVRCRE